MTHESDPRAGLKLVAREWFKMVHEDGRADWLARDQSARPADDLT